MASNDRFDCLPADAEEPRVTCSLGLVPTAVQTAVVNMQRNGFIFLLFTTFSTSVANPVHIECHSLDGIGSESADFCDLHCNDTVTAESTFVFGHRVNFVYLWSTCQFVELPRGFFKHYHNVKSLEIPSIGLRRLSPETFEGASQVEFLDLFSNNFGRLVTNVFSPLVNLRHLSLFNSNITIIEDGGFSGLFKLETLELSFNLLTFLPETIFRELTMLKGLSLANNRLETLSEVIFDGLTRLSQIDLSNNPLIVLPEKIFAPLTEPDDHLEIKITNTNLRTANFTKYGVRAKFLLRDNQIEHLHIGSAVLSIRAQWNRIRSISCDEENPMIQEVSLFSNELTEFGCLSRLTEVEHLRLGRNRIERVDEMDVKAWSKLVELDLEWNGLNWFDGGAVLQWMPNLKQLWIRGNRLQELVIPTETVPLLRYIDISENYLIGEELMDLVVMLDNREPTVHVTAFHEKHEEQSTHVPEYDYFYDYD